MINLFNRAVLLQDPNAETAAKARADLKKAGIPYKTKTEKIGSAEPSVRIPRTGRTGFMGGTADGPYMAGGVPHSWAEGGSPDWLYTVYVRKKDLARAKEICGL